MRSDQPSKLNTALDVPTTPDDVRPAVPLRSCPRVPMHATDVAVVQLEVLQSASASTAVTVDSVAPKLMPVKVTLAGSAPTLHGLPRVRTGADEFCSFN